MATATRSLIEIKLQGRSLEELVRSGRSEGKSWHRITKAIEAETEIEVSSETLRLWFRHLDSELVSSRSQAASA
ncbi:hypothetical protein [Arthrobacter sp. B1805]|uniref:hypothetical protein n=1 Tax=Arthrobacter sp. B1805 TaxID=2058892 RepID=UPI000CE57105|nr:hypothetical protein [Arthrobacter sp. B1805]